MITLTASQLRLLTMCERRVWLDKYGNRESRIDVSSVTTLPFTTGIQHEEQIHTATAPFTNETPVATWQEAVQATRDAMAHKHSVIGACLETEIEIQGKPVRLMGRIDRLQRAQDGAYYPVEIKQYTTLDTADVLQLDFYCFLVGQIQGNIPHGEFWVGTAAQTVHHEFNAELFENALKQWAATLQQQDEPAVIYRSHCRACHWHDSCIDALKQQRSIQLLHSIRRDSVKSLEASGIHTVDQFATLTLEEVRKIKGIKSTAERYLAQAQAYVQDAPQWYQVMPSLLHKGGTMFDLETIVEGDNIGTAWSLGWSDTDGQAHIAVVNDAHQPASLALADKLMVHVVRHADNAWYTLLDSIGHLDTPIYHWTGFDAGVMANTAPKQVQQALLPRMHDLYKTFTDTVQLPVRSYSIKVVAAYFGFQWQGYAQWDAAYNDYKLWCLQWDAAALHRACAYQRDDVLALVRVWHWMTQSQ